MPSPVRTWCPLCFLRSTRSGAVLAAHDERGVVGGHQPLPVQRDDVVEVALRRLAGLVQTNEQVHGIVRHVSLLRSVVTTLPRPATASHAGPGSSATGA